MVDKFLKFVSPIKHMIAVYYREGMCLKTLIKAAIN